MVPSSLQVGTNSNFQIDDMLASMEQALLSDSALEPLLKVSQPPEQGTTGPC